MVTREDILEVLRGIDDPEMPISIVDLGIIDDIHIRDAGSGTADVDVDVLPTFVGCPALPVIENEISKKLSASLGIREVHVHFKFHPAWTVDRITEIGRARLKSFGVTVPHVRESLAEVEFPPVCPLCGSSDVTLESPFGPTRCRMIYHCQACKNPFEHLKRIALEQVVPLGRPGH